MVKYWSINQENTRTMGCNHFVAELAKDSEKVPKSINFKRIYTMLGTKEKQTTRVTLEFLSNVIPVSEKCLLLFQKSSPVVHFLV